MHRNRISRAVLLAALLLPGCTSMKSHWPFGRGQGAPPPQVSVLEVQSPAPGVAAQVLQYWERNTLVLDLRNVPAAGQAVLTRRGDSWPARIALRMAAQQFEVVEVRGAQRVVLPVAAGAGVVTADLPPAVHDRSAAALTIRWGGKGEF